MSFGITQEQVRLQFDDTPPAIRRSNANNGEPFDTIIGDLVDGYRTFTILVRAFLSPYPPGNHALNGVDMEGNDVVRHVVVHPMSESDLSGFRRGAERDIEESWNGNGNGRLWLTAVDITRGYRDVNLSTAIPPPLKCVVQLEWVSSPRDGHLHISVMNTGTSPYPRSNCALGGRRWIEDAGAFILGEGNAVDMVMHTYQVGDRQNNAYPVQRGADAPAASPAPQQSVFAHEFGHYLGLRHPYAGRRGTSRGAGGEYGIGMGNPRMFYYLMGVGNDMIPMATTPWHSRLARHGYFPGRAFRPTRQERGEQAARERSGWSLTAPPQVSMLRTVSIRGFGD